MTYYTSPEGHAKLMAWYDAALANVEHITHNVTTRWGQTHVLNTGSPDAPPVVLLHGLNINAAVWLPQLGALARSCRVIAPDVPGFAGKSDAVRFPYRGRPFADWLADTLDGLGIERALIVGSSAGGWFALKFAAYYPHRATALLVMNPCGVAPYRPLMKLTRWQAAVTFAHWLRPLAARYWLARRVVQRSMAPGMQPTEANVELAYLLLRYYTRRIAPPLLPDHELTRVTAPVTLLMGERESYTYPTAAIERLQRTLPNLETAEILPGAGHDLNKERPNVINARILDVLSQSIARQSV